MYDLIDLSLWRMGFKRRVELKKKISKLSKPEYLPGMIPPDVLQDFLTLTKDTVSTLLQIKEKRKAMSQQENKPFQWDEQKIRGFAEYYRKTQGNVSPELWGKDLMEEFKATHSSSEKADWEVTNRNLRKIHAPEEEPVLFTTHDGVDIREGEGWFSVHVHKNHEITYTDSTKGETHNPDFKGLRFSTRELAENYCLMNRPILSVNDVIGNRLPNSLNLWENSRFFGISEEKLKELAKQKIGGSK